MHLESFRSASPSDIRSVAGLLRLVLSAEGAAPLEAVHQAVLTSVFGHLFGVAVPAADVGLAALPPGLAQGAAELALIMPLVDPVMDRRKVEAAGRATAAMGFAFPQVAMLRDAAEGRLQRLRMRVSNRLVTQLAGVGILGAIRAEFGIGEAGMMVHAGQPRWAAAGQHAVLGGQRRRGAG